MHSGFCSIQIDLTGCGTTKGCSRAPAGCQNAFGDCFYVITQQADHDTGSVRFELAGQVGGWGAIGYNFNYTMVRRANNMRVCA